VVLTETRTDDMNRLMIGLSSSHRLISNTSIPFGCAGRRGFGVAVAAANSCADFLTLHEASQSLQCVWVCCKGSLFGLAQNAMLGAVYIPPQSTAFPRAQVTDSFLALTDELSCASKVAPHFLLCGDLNAKVGGLNEVTHAHKSLLVAHPALQFASWCESQAIDAAGRLLADLASSLNGILGTGRVCGDNGQASYVGSPRQEVASRPDYILMSSALSGWQIVCRFCQLNTSVITAR